MGIYWGYSPLILSFDPNFLGHPSGEGFSNQNLGSSTTHDPRMAAPAAGGEAEAVGGTQPAKCVDGKLGGWP